MIFDGGGVSGNYFQVSAPEDVKYSKGQPPLEIFLKIISRGGTGAPGLGRADFVSLSYNFALFVPTGPCHRASTAKPEGKKTHISAELNIGGRCIRFGEKQLLTRATCAWEVYIVVGHFIVK